VQHASVDTSATLLILPEAFEMPEKAIWCLWNAKKTLDGQGSTWDSAGGLTALPRLPNW